MVPVLSPRQKEVGNKHLNKIDTPVSLALDFQPAKESKMDIKFYVIAKADSPEKLAEQVEKLIKERGWKPSGSVVAYHEPANSDKCTFIQPLVTQ